MFLLCKLVSVSNVLNCHTEHCKCKCQIKGGSFVTVSIIKLGFHPKHCIAQLDPGSEIVQLVVFPQKLVKLWLLVNNTMLYCTAKILSQAD